MARKAQRVHSSLTLVVGLAWLASVPPAQPLFGGSDKAVELVLDASGSMAGRLADQTMRLEAAKSAVRQFVEELPAETTLAFRVYGHQSPRERHDCQDTQVLVPFGAASRQKASIFSAAGPIAAQGYTPISYVLEQAAADFSAVTGSGSAVDKVIILISDGKETCDGDPCAVAQALATADARLVVHTVGFGVDSATQGQLECIAHATGGRYFSAESAPTLSTVLGEAVETEGVKPEAAAGTGWLGVVGATIHGHQVTQASSGEVVGRISSVNAVIELPAGIYNVAVGKALWKSIEVRAGEKTLLEPAQLSVRNASLTGHRITDAETGEVQAEVSSSANWTALLPGSYDVWFGPLAWRVQIEAGDQRELAPGTVQVKNADIGGHAIRTAAGTAVGSVSATMDWLPLPAGDYQIDIDGRAEAFHLAEGQDLVFSR